MTIKISIYEKNDSLLERLSYLVLGTENFELCTTSSSIVHLIDDCKQLCPDIVLMDIDKPEISGAEAILLLKNLCPEINVMVLTVFEDIDNLFDALCAGATGCLLKNTPPAQLIEAIEELYHGGSPMSSVIARKVLDSFSKSIHPAGFFTRPVHGEKQDNYKLTKREREVLQRLLMGDSYKMVANACFISIGTVYSHINNIYKKLQINSKSEAVIKAIKERLI